MHKEDDTGTFESVKLSCILLLLYCFLGFFFSKTHF